MKTQKLSFNAISGVLSRSEMKKIMAGSGTCQTLDTPPGAPAGTGYVNTGVMYGSASDGSHTHYCCDSCCSASWSVHTGC